MLRGLTFILIAVLLMSVTLSNANSASLQYVKGTRIRVPVGEVVTVHTTVKAINGPVSGTLKVEVKKDIVMLPDEVYKTLIKQISLSQGQISEIEMGTFTASDKTGNSIGQVRQYFIKVYFNDQVIYDPTNPSTRECVETY